MITLDLEPKINIPKLNVTVTKVKVEIRLNSRFRDL